MTASPNQGASRQPAGSVDALREMHHSRLRALLRDFTLLLGQQMYFWGQDVIHPRGNLLREAGFERRKSEGLDGTSCYRQKLEGHGMIELHGACAGFYNSDATDRQSFLYIRNRKRCFLYSGEEPPAPGYYEEDTLNSGPTLELYLASQRFLDWWLEYERWIATETSPSWRDRSFEAYRKLPAAPVSLRPADAVQWLAEFRTDPRTTVRLRERQRTARA